MTWSNGWAFDVLSRPYVCVHRSISAFGIWSVKTQYFGKVSQHQLSDETQGTGLGIIERGMAVHRPISVNLAAGSLQQQVCPVSVMISHYDQC